MSKKDLSFEHQSYPHSVGNLGVNYQQFSSVSFLICKMDPSRFLRKTFHHRFMKEYDSTPTLLHKHNSHTTLAPGMSSPSLDKLKKPTSPD